MATKPFPAYKGDEPYIFVSYSHDDEELVFPELKTLQNLGINVWYDEGISPGSRWSDALARALAGASHFVFLVTPRSANSQNCMDEVGFALEKNKPVLAIHLARTELPDGLALRLGSRQSILKYEFDALLYRNKLEESLGQHAHSPRMSDPNETGVDLAKADRIYASAAVLPFENRSDDPELTDLGETIGEEITYLMSNVMHGKRLLGGTETAPYAARGATSREIAEELEVGLVVRGNIRKTGEKVRITAELVSEKGEQLWSHRFDVAQEELARREDRILDMIIAGVDSSARTLQWQLAADTPDEALGPWGLYSKVRGANWMRSRSAREKARARILRAIELDPHPVFMADAAFMIAAGVMEGGSRDREADIALARHYAETAASSNRCYAVMSAGGAFSFLGEHERGVRLAKRAYEMAPRWHMALEGYAQVLLYSGDAAGSLAKYMESVELRLPGQPSADSYIAQCHTILGNHAEGLTWARQAIDQDSTSQRNQSVYANLLAEVDRIDEAVAAIESIKRSLPEFTIRKSINAYRRLLGTDEARDAATRGLRKLLDLGYA